MPNTTNRILRSGCWDKYESIDMCSWQFITTTVVLSIVVISIIIGNSLVITAVALYGKLRKSISNSFIASLALADLLLGLLVLPLSLSQAIFGYWSFGEFMCKAWLIVDIWVCTASILHLCAISLDRYLAIAYPLRYPRLMTHRRCRIICLAMWLLSFVICFPASIQWEGDESQSENEYSNSTSNITKENSTLNFPVSQKCAVVNDSAGYTVYSALGSFFIPSIIMTGFYIKIFLMARRFMAQSKSGQIRAENSGEQSMRIHRGTSTKQSLYKSAKSVYEMSGLLTVEPKLANAKLDNGFQELPMDDLSQQQVTSNGSSLYSTLRKSSCKSDRSDHHLLNSLRRTKNVVGTTLNRETRAAKTVAIIVGGFILCWSPFFICYLVQGTSNIKIDDILFDVFFWIGYINSLLNPCIYAYFSMDYRHAFKKILRCQLRRERRSSGLFRFTGSLYVSSSSDRHNSITINPHQLA